jgi:glycosyltransferase involved in cell wall biosynthesis
LGAVPNKQLTKVYQEHDVFVLPSYSEVWGLVVEEALNNGLPVIVSSRVGCTDEIIEDGRNGLIFKNNDADSLLSCIHRIQNVDLYNKMRKHISELDFVEIERAQAQCYI